MHSHTRKSVRVLGFGLGAIGMFVLAACASPTPGDDDVNVDVRDPLKTQGGPNATYSRCEPITVKGTQSQNFAISNPFIGNSRLSLITPPGGKGRYPTVACMNVETLQTGTCSFFTDQPHIHLKYDPVKRVGNSGSWLLGADGRQYAQAGQRIDPSGTVEGDWVVASVVSQKGTVPCVRPKSSDAAGTAAGTELAGSCIVETMLSGVNASYELLANYATKDVCTSTYPHPDKAPLKSNPSPNVYCYTQSGAGLNDLNGTERDQYGIYIPGSNYCHVGWSGGIEVLAAKRPATKSVPYPGSVNPTTDLSWKPVNDRVTIANP